MYLGFSMICMFIKSTFSVLSHKFHNFRLMEYRMFFIAHKYEIKITQNDKKKFINCIQRLAGRIQYDV